MEYTYICPICKHEISCSTTSRLPRLLDEEKCPSCETTLEIIEKKKHRRKIVIDKIDWEMIVQGVEQ